MVPTWPSLLPLTQAGWAGSEAALRCLADHVEFLCNTARAALQKKGADPQEREAVGAIYLQLADKIVRRRGLPVKSLDDDGAPGWFATVIRREAASYARGLRKRQQREGAPPDDRDEAAATDGADEPWLGDVSRALAHAQRSGVPAPQLLTLVAWHTPRMVSRPLVDAAAAYQSGTGSASGRPGLYRPAGETWALLEPWAAAHAADPAHQRARVGLAWVLRSEDRTSAERWAAEHAEELKSALAVLRRWVSRAQARLSGGGNHDGS